MNSEKLSNRLMVVASFVESGAIVADIGSDHAYLPCFLVNACKINKAIAGEVVKGPYESAVKNVKKNGLDNAITVRLANGLHVIQEADAVDTVTIAGMGGPLIASILEEGSSQLQTVSRIIAQPNIHALAIRQWAIKNNWQLVDEEIIKEDHKIYEVLVLERGEASYNEAEMLVGPFLAKKRSSVFLEKWERELVEWQRIVQELQQAGESSNILMKKRELQTKIDLVRSVLSR
ncbi:tRNA (adenine(22)-N(1))-methyltransferase TrmK [Sporosarcina sp. OR05]|uniref:tRNA (adenine(22)-N(1))-methyltransferase n=1 Tax=Sporosarcina sp. OR05 TaxID=2969819 RepID=UPI00352ADA08